jgi:hypothetical protein
VSARPTRRPSVIGGPPSRPVNRIELAGAVVAIVLGVAALLYYTGDGEPPHGEINRRLDALEKLTATIPERNQYVLNLGGRVAALEKAIGVEKQK